MKTASIENLLEFKGAKIYFVPPSLTVAEAAREMDLRNIGCLLVMEGGRLLGVLTAHEILHKVVADDVSSRRTEVKDIMRTDVPSIGPSGTVADAMELFETRHCRHLPVIDNGLVIGLLSIGDLSRWCATESRAEMESMRDFINTGLRT